MKTNLKFLTLAILFSFAALISCGEKKEKKETVSEEKTEVKEDTPKEETTKVSMKDKMIEHFKSIDSNNDGKVEEEEFNAHIKSEFVEKDANKDGKIQEDECGKFDKLNTDGNDFVSEEEFAKGHADMMKKIDADGDGSFTQDEFLSFKREMMKKMKGMKCGGDMKKDAGKKMDDAKKTMKCAPGKCGGN